MSGRPCGHLSLRSGSFPTIYLRLGFIFLFICFCFYFVCKQQVFLTCLDVPVACDGVVTAKEDSDVVLPCSLGSDSREKMFIWKKDKEEVFSYDPAYKNDIYGKGQRNQDPKFKERVSYFNDHLDSGNASIKIHKAVVKDSGNYSCIYVDKSQGSKETTISHICLTVGES